jgi:superfamily II DNA/RNA helicase
MDERIKKRKHTTFSDNLHEERPKKQSKLDILNNYSNFDLDEKQNNHYEPFQRSFYKEHKNISKMTSDGVNDYRSQNHIKVFYANQNDIPKPVPLFEYMNKTFPKHVQQTISELKFKKPTAIQSQAWPIIFSGYDMIGLAETGSGKTLAFVLPGLVHVSQQKNSKMLVLAPTRELAQQIQIECEKYSAHSTIPIGILCLYGGELRKNQIKSIKHNSANIIIATPGRLLDFLQADVISLRNVTFLVLDEADRMLDMGFAPQIKQICSQMRPDRQTLMFSATWSKTVQDASADFIPQEPFIVNIGAIGTSVNENVKQEFLFIRENDKLNKLLSVLEINMTQSSRVLIFCQTKNRTDYVTSKLREQGWPALSMHGSRNQREREWVISEFRTGQAPIMVATDVAARGLDIEDVTLVVNYDMALDIESHVHRVGRTGRAGKIGRAISLFTPENAHLSKRMIQLLKEAKQIVPLQLEKLSELLNK